MASKRDEQRTGGFIPWSKVDRRLRALREIWVATASPRGVPDAVPVWFWWDGETLYFTTKAASRKARNLIRCPALVLHNGDGADPIILTGNAEVVDDPAELERVDRAYHEKYVDPGSGASATIFVEGDVVFRLRPRLVMAWEYATCANRTDWRFEAAELTVDSERMLTPWATRSPRSTSSVTARASARSARRSA